MATKPLSKEEKARRAAARAASKTPVVAAPTNFRGAYAKPLKEMTDEELRLYARHEHDIEGWTLPRAEILRRIDDAESYNASMDRKALIDLEAKARGNVQASR